MEMVFVCIDIFNFLSGEGVGQSSDFYLSRRSDVAKMSCDFVNITISWGPKSYAREVDTLLELLEMPGGVSEHRPIHPL
jgi:hypothetical protein